MVSRVTPDQDLQNFLDAVPKEGRVLDFGCGPGNSAKMMQDTGLRVDAIDASSEMVKMANDKFGVNAKLGTFDTLTVKNYYHGIWANFSLLHADKADMPSHLKAIHAALKPSGHFHIGMKLGSGSQRDDLERMYTYYEEQELCDLMTAAGFSIIATRQGSVEGMAGGKEPFVIVTANA
jgi:trans-aconitate methyltransferase